MSRNTRLFIVVGLLIPLVLSAQDIQEQIFDKNLLFFENTVSSSTTEKDGIDKVSVSCGGHQTNHVSAGYNDLARFAYCQVTNYSSGGFETPTGSEIDYLWQGGIWIGGIVGDDTLVSSSCADWNGYFEFQPPGGSPTVTEISGQADQNLRAVSCDTVSYIVSFDSANRPHIPLNLEVINRSHSFQTAPFDKGIIYDMIVTNVGEQLIEKAFIGFFFDGDVYPRTVGGNGWDDDLAGSLKEHGIAYIIDNDGDPVPGQGPFGTAWNDTCATRIFAFNFLETSFEARDTNFNWWSNGRGLPEYDFGPRRKDTVLHEYLDGLGSARWDKHKYYMLSFPEWDYDQVATAAIDSTDPYWLFPPQSFAPDLSNGYDTRFLMSIGPVDLLPDSSVRLLFSTFTGEYVHWDPDNFHEHVIENYVPGLYVSRLNFSDVINTAYWTNMVVDTLLDPMIAPPGVHIKSVVEDSVVIEWDPWVFNDITGYDIYITEVPSQLQPYPGVAAPWLWPANPDLYVQQGITRRCIIHQLNDNKIFAVNVAHRVGPSSGDRSEPIYITPPYFAPPVVSRFVMAAPGEPITINWADTSNKNIDHYNIYRFDSEAPADAAYHPYYDSGQSLYFRTPRNVFDIDDMTYYYYAMEPWLQVDSSMDSFTDYEAQDGYVYIIEAVNKNGFSSEFSNKVSAVIVPPRENRVLVVTGGNSSYNNFVFHDTVKAFYDSVLAGYSPRYDYDVYNLWDTLNTYGPDGFDWHHLMSYRVVIVDDGLSDQVITDAYETSREGYSRYIESGGILVYFGSLKGLLGLSYQPDSARLEINHWFVNQFFGVDSIHYISPGFFELNGVPLVDDPFAFSYAQGVDGLTPDINYDDQRFPYTTAMENLWPASSAPAVVTYMISEGGQPLHYFRALTPTTSVQEGELVGVKTDVGETETYLFGFHLWYMNHAEARQLIEMILPISTCCLSLGDMNHSGGLTPVDISDLTYYIEYLFAGGPAPYCFEEADITGDNLMDISDLTALIDFAFGDSAPMPTCP